MKVFYFTLLLMQVGLPAVFHAALGKELGINRLKVQAKGPRFVVGEFSTCSDTCGGGFRIRRVSCLDANGVISVECTGEPPSSYEFCNQSDCSTGVFDRNIIPDTGLYFFNMPRGNVQFLNQGGGKSLLAVTISNYYGGRAVVYVVKTPSEIKVNTTIFPATPSTTVDNKYNFALNDRPIININGIKRTNITINDSIQLINNTVIDSNGIILAPVVDMFTYYGRFTFYIFNVSIANPLSGPGVFYYNSIQETAVYSINVKFNADLDKDAILITEPPPTTKLPQTVEPPQTTQPSAMKYVVTIRSTGLVYHPVWTLTTFLIICFYIVNKKILHDS